jgi:hypothetical protein
MPSGALMTASASGLAAVSLTTAGRSERRLHFGERRSPENDVGKIL